MENDPFANVRLVMAPFTYDPVRKAYVLKHNETFRTLMSKYLTVKGPIDLTRLIYKEAITLIIDSINNALINSKYKATSGGALGKTYHISISKKDDNTFLESIDINDSEIVVTARYIRDGDRDAYIRLMAPLIKYIFLHTVNRLGANDAMANKKMDADMLILSDGTYDVLAKEYVRSYVATKENISRRPPAPPKAPGIMGRLFGSQGGKTRKTKKSRSRKVKKTRKH